MPVLKITLHKASRKEIAAGTAPYFGTATVLEDVPAGTTIAIKGKTRRVLGGTKVDMVSVKRLQGVVT